MELTEYGTQGNRTSHLLSLFAPISFRSLVLHILVMAILPICPSAVQLAINDSLIPMISVAI